MSPYSSQFIISQPYIGRDAIMISDLSTLPIHITGTILVPTSMGAIWIPNILHVLGLHHSLMSIKCLAKVLNCTFSLDQHGFTMHQKGMESTLLHGNSCSRLYNLTGKALSISTGLSCIHTSWMVWHRRFRHPSQLVLQQLLKIDPSSGQASIDSFCDICSSRKSQCQPYSPRTHTTSSPLELLHINLWGPSLTTSHDGYYYYCNIQEK